MDRFLFGENPRPIEVAIALLTGAGLAAFVTISAFDQLPSDYKPLRAAILAVLVADTTGGIIANLTSSTTEYYASKPLFVNIGFLIVHIIPLLLAVEFLGMSNTEATFLFVYSLVAGSIVVFLTNNPLQKVIGIAFLVMGIGLYSALFQSIAPPMGWIGPLFLTKLVYAFAVKHYN